MDIRDISNKANVNRAGNRAERADHERKGPVGSVAQDEATISVNGRHTLATVEGLAERARRDGSERQDLVAAAAARLASGELGSPESLRKTAQHLLDANFLAG